jgi:DNA-binding NtrC family response regulator
MRASHRRILIVDPDSEATHKLSSLFINQGYDVEISEGLTTAAERLSDVKFDCVIIDVNLPEMEGFKAAPILKVINPNVRIIMTSADNTMDLEEKVRQQDIFYYYIKSFDQEELQEAVRDVFKKDI